MLNKSKLRLIGIIKRTAALLLAIAMLCGLVGCGKSETNSSAVSDSSSEPQRVLADTSKFDFVEAVKNMTLFGQKISLPCYWSDFGGDFSHDEIYLSSDDEFMCSLRYKDKIIGNIFFGGCEPIEDISEAESYSIVCIVIGFTDYGPPYDEADLQLFERMGYYTDEIELALGDITMSSTESDIIAALGEPTKLTEGGSRWHYLDYKYANGYLHIVMDVNKDLNGIMELYIGIYVG